MVRIAGFKFPCIGSILMTKIIQEQTNLLGSGISESDFFKVVYTNAELLMRSFLMRKVKLEIEMIFIQNERPQNILVFVLETKYHSSLRKWEEYKSAHPSLSHLNLLILKYAEKFATLVENLFPKINVLRLEIEENRYTSESNYILRCVVPSNQIKYAVGKSGWYVKLCNGFLKKYAPDFQIVFDS